MMFGIESALHKTRFLVIVVDVLYACFVECCVCLSEGEEVDGEVGLVWLSDGKIQGCWEG